MNGATSTKFQLDWSSISGTQANFFNTFCLLELLHRGLRESEIPRSQSGISEDGGHEDEVIDRVEEDGSETSSDESSPDSFEKPAGNGNSVLEKTILRDKFLDRLAEILARYKDDPGAKIRQANKHIASAYMEEHGDESVELFIAKNEGLYPTDEAYLKSLGGFLQDLSQKKVTPTDIKTAILKCTINYVEPRLNYYVDVIAQSFASRAKEKDKELSRNTSFEEGLKRLRLPSYRKWTDPNGLEYDIPCQPNLDKFQRTRSAQSGESLEQIAENARKLFEEVRELSQLGRADRLLCFEQLLETAHQFQLDVRGRASIQACFDRHFLENKGPRVARTSRRAFLFMCRVYRSVLTFIQAAEKLSCFRSITFHPVTQPRISSKVPRGSYPSLTQYIAAELHINEITSDMHRLLNTEKKREDFDDLRRKRRIMHAEIQTVFEYLRRASVRKQETIVHSYIGCSKLCCVFCYLFILFHGRFRVRGCHRTVYHSWETPRSFSSRAAAMEFQDALQKTFQLAKQIVASVLKGAIKSSGDLLHESTVACSIAETVSSSAVNNMTLRPRDPTPIMPMVMNDAIIIMPNPERPGYAIVAGGALPNAKVKDMSLEEAERYKDRHDEKKLLPKYPLNSQRQCHRCKKPSNMRCSGCWMSYCSKPCQQRDWRRHLFICNSQGRPNKADNFIWLMRRYLRSPPGATAVDSTNFRKHLYLDDDLCRMFGFNQCGYMANFINLTCLYQHLIFGTTISSTKLQFLAENHLIEEQLRVMIDNPKSDFCSCVIWFRQFVAESEGPFLDDSKLYVHVTEGLSDVYLTFKDIPEPIVGSSEAVFDLYALLFRDFDNIPNEGHSAWINFGFCHCRSDGMKVEMASAYKKLAQVASFRDIVQAWEQSKLNDLMIAHGIDISTFTARNIVFGRPAQNQMMIYRLMAEVHHILAGTFCLCALRGPCWNYTDRDTRISRESDGDFGFHLTNAWDRWSLILLYSVVFAHPEFDPEKMLAARMDVDLKAFVKYIEALVPDFYKHGHFYNMYKSEKMLEFRLRGRLKREHSQIPECYCIAHSIYKKSDMVRLTKGPEDP